MQYIFTYIYEFYDTVQNNILWPGNEIIVFVQYG
jgi:hypothetical protein